MSLTLSDEQALALRARAAAEGRSLEEWILRLAEPAGNSGRTRTPIWEAIDERMRRVPREDLEALPKDWREPDRPLRLRCYHREHFERILRRYFFWVALTSTEDPAHERAMALSHSNTRQNNHDR